MTDTYEREDVVNTLEYDDSDLEYELVTEIATRLIYQAKVFDEFAIIRPANPQWYGAIDKIDIEEFTALYEEYAGDHAKLKEYLTGETVDILS